MRNKDIETILMLKDGQRIDIFVCELRFVFILLSCFLC